jgi:outer membrane lipoprotein-sorting protein
MIQKTLKTLLRTGPLLAAVISAGTCGAVLLAQDARPPRGTTNTQSRTPPATSAEPGAFDEAIRVALEARERLKGIQDYTCTFIKRERINGQLLPEEYIVMKARNRPFSVYMKWQRPYEGREVIYAQGQYDGKVMAHSTGVEKVVGGTVALDPRGSMAMENSRHDITEAGIGNLVNQLVTRWQKEKQLGQTKVEVKENANVDGRPCICVKTQHPQDPKNYSYFRSRVFFDKENGLPIRFEGYDWPRRGSPPEGDVVESYTYRDLKINVSLTGLDFNVENPKYNFGRL